MQTDGRQEFSSARRLLELSRRQLGDSRAGQGGLGLLGVSTGVDEDDGAGIIA
jgi:hypothetical protein